MISRAPKTPDPRVALRRILEAETRFEEAIGDPGCWQTCDTSNVMLERKEVVLALRAADELLRQPPPPVERVDHARDDLRDGLAKEAMESRLADPTAWPRTETDALNLSLDCYQLADAMLAVRETQGALAPEADAALQDFARASPASAQLLARRIRGLQSALAAVLPYAESQAEDLTDGAALDPPANPSPDEAERFSKARAAAEDAWKAVDEAQSLLEESGNRPAPSRPAPDADNLCPCERLATEVVKGPEVGRGR